MRAQAIAIGGAALLATGWAAAGAAEAQTELVVRDAAARVVVLPEDRIDVSVTVNQPASALPRIMQSRDGDRLILDGHIGRNVNCRGGRGRPTQVTGDFGTVDAAQLPQIVARVPRNAVVSAGPAVWGEIGRAQSATLNLAGCGDWFVAHVSGPLQVNAAGSGDVRTGNAQSVRVRVAGSGDVRVRTISGEFTADVAGSGDVRAEQTNGAVRVRVAGSGDVIVESGRAPELSAQVAGSGDVRFNGRAERVSAQIAGSGDVTVRSAGSVTRAVVGSGRVTVGS